MPNVTMIMAGTLDDASWVKPESEIFCDSAQPWVQLGGETVPFPEKCRRHRRTELLANVSARPRGLVGCRRKFNLWRYWRRARLLRQVVRRAARNWPLIQALSTQLVIANELDYDAVVALIR